MKRAGNIPAALALAAALSGCEIADKIPLTPRQATEAAKPVGTPSKEKLEDTDEGTLYRWTVEAQHSATWGHALTAIRRQREVRCPDGQYPLDLDYTPELDKTSQESFSEKHPPGTLFVLKQRCPAPPDYQFTFDSRLSPAEAGKLIDRRLQERAGGPLVSTVVLSLHVSPDFPLFEHVRLMLSTFAQSQAATCPDAFRFSYLTLGVQPGPDDDEQSPDAYLGFIADCVDGAKSAPLP
ncbi:hypothetical protein [Arenimonas donghaensis]|uniref:Lipoprotein n=1 Tax=Arenimonas donghaensis DSM 18148 = HO3-R19 TaxID=1121014 RepID=A0A087MKB1_9GAMM|nr:hypothetical protein [Arenimonas donghaensis]KFL37314.1 hypothetical protein N788_09960 [Arenimonas donghaensis DSM 18148 = HO3-R19]